LEAGEAILSIQDEDCSAHLNIERFAPNKADPYWFAELHKRAKFRLIVSDGDLTKFIEFDQSVISADTYICDPHFSILSTTLYPIPQI
jgi:hypothetical protein